jgi:hypothetical protein
MFAANGSNIDRGRRMSKEPDSKSADGSEDIEREIRRTRKFSLNEAIGQIAGGDFMKGGTPVSRTQQAELEIEDYLRRHLDDSGGVLRRVLLRHLGESLIASDYTEPLAALAKYIPRLLASDHLLEEFVREADVEWGRVYDERPHFEAAGRPPHPHDPYTIASVRLSLARLCERLASAGT